MPRLPGVPPNIALLTGPMLLGNLFGYGLFGILVVQVFIYHYRFPRDPAGMKALVWSVFSVDVLITIFATITAWDGLAAGWGNSDTLAPLDWPFGGLPLLSGLVSSSVHLFFCWRIWKLQKNLILPVLIGLISITQWIMASYCGIRGRSLGIVRINELKPFVIVWLGGSALCDVLITTAMVTILFRASSQSAFRATNSVMAKLITLTVETGLTTTVGALCELIFFLIFPNNNMHFLPFLMLAKLYSNTLLATLNARATFGQSRGKAALWNEDSSVSTGSHVLSSRGQVSLHGPNASRALMGGVQVTTKTERREDMEMVVIADPGRDDDASFFPGKKDFIHH